MNRILSGIGLILITLWLLNLAGFGDFRICYSVTHGVCSGVAK